jgi:hypothetical protein
MLKDPAPVADCSECRGEAPAILAALEPFPVARLNETGQPTPPSAGRMSNDRMWPGVESRVPFLVPWVDARQAGVAAPGLDVEGGNNRHGPTLA